jgi:prevent-host-death family protein
MAVKFSEDIVPISDLKVNPGRIVRQVADTHRPVVLTSRGRGVAVLRSLQDHETEVAEKDFMRAVVQGMADLEEGRQLSLAQVKKRLGMK